MSAMCAAPSFKSLLRPVRPCLLLQSYLAQLSHFPLSLQMHYAFWSHGDCQLLPPHGTLASSPSTGWVRLTFSSQLKSHVQEKVIHHPPGQGTILMLNNLLKTCFFSSDLPMSAITHLFVGLFNVWLFMGLSFFVFWEQGPSQGLEKYLLNEEILKVSGWHIRAQIKDGSAHEISYLPRGKFDPPCWRK